MSGGLTSKKLVVIYSVLFGIIVLASAGVVYITVMGNILGKFTFFGDPLMGDLDIRIGVLDSGYSKMHLRTLKGGISTDLHEVWLERLGETGFPAEVLTDRTLPEKLGEYDVLVLPASVCLSAAEREAVRDFLDGGGGVLCTWATGVRDEHGNWRGWEFLSEIAGVRVWGETREHDRGIGYFFFNGNRILSSGIPAGFRIELAHYDSGVLATAGSADAYYSNWRLEPVAGGSVNESYCAVSHTEKGRGRVVWYGFNIALPKMTEKSKPVLDRLIGNSIRWAAQHPVAGLATWPLSERSAVVFAVDAERDFENVQTARELFERNAVPTTFFCVAQAAAAHREITRKISAAGEVASHGDRHEIFAGQPEEVQAGRLLDSRETLVYITGRPVVGFRPPEEEYDDATTGALREAEFEYLVANDRSRDGFDRAVPDFIGPGGDLVRIPRVGLDDYWLLVVEDSRDPYRTMSAMKADFERVHRMGGVYFLSLHTHLTSTPEWMDILENMINYIKSEDSWITTCADLVDWWNKRERVRIRAGLVSWRRVALSVSSLHEEVIPDVGVILSLPHDLRSVTLESDMVEFSRPSYEFDGDDRMIIHIRDLLPFENRTYWIDLTSESDR